MSIRAMTRGLLVAASITVGALVAQAAETPTAGLIDSLKSADSAARLKAINELGSRGAKATEAVAALAGLLADPSADVRAHALWALGAIGEPAKPLIPQIVALIKDPDPAVRRQTLRTVQAIRPGPQVVVPLAVKLLEESDSAMQVRVLNAITEAGASAVPGLIEALKNDKAAYWALLILREIGPEAKDAAPAVAEKLKDKQATIRLEAVLTLGAMGEAADSILPQIAAMLGDAHTRTAATFVLGERGKIPADALPTVRANAKSDDKLLSTTSLWALARVFPEDKPLRREASEQLVARLKDPNPFVRTAAARALAALPPAPEIMTPIFEKVLQDADPTTMHFALDALASLGAPAVPRLVDALKHEKLRGEVAYILGQIGPPAAPATDALTKLIADKHSRVAHEAIVALGKIGPAAKAAVPALVAALQKGSDEDMNYGAVAYALGRIGPDAVAALPALLSLVKGSDRHVALLSAWALAQISPSSTEVAVATVPVLIGGLQLPEATLRHLAADALGDLGPLAKPASAALKKAATDEDATVREAAVAALHASEQARPAGSPSKPLAVGDTAVILSDNISLKAGEQEIARLAKGTKVTVREVRGNWIAVQLSLDGSVKVGWVQSSQVGSP